MSTTNPLFPDADEQDEKPTSYVLSAKTSSISPASNTPNSAADLIREKLDRIYAEEPSAKQELAEAKAAKPRSKHQEFMYKLQSSGKGLAQIQTDWHNYYVSLPDSQKHEVWQEFYESNANSAYFANPATQLPPTQSPQVPDRNPSGVIAGGEAPAARRKDARSPAIIKRAIRKHVTADGKLKAKHHLQSLAFGLGVGFLALFIFLFGFFNEFFIAPFIQPGRTASATPIILDANSVAPSSTPEVIIPKINVEIPVDYTQTSTDENVIENALQNGIVHYPDTVLPGQDGNAAFFGHSSNNIFNKGKYKFAFVLLHELVPGDTFYLTNDGKVYVYKVISKNIVDPGDVSVLGPVAGQIATATLITCDPPGTSLHRLIIVGQQVSPDPSTNTASPAPVNSAIATPTTLAGNGPTAWTRFWHWLF